MKFYNLVKIIFLNSYKILRNEQIGVHKKIIVQRKGIEIF